MNIWKKIEMWTGLVIMVGCAAAAIFLLFYGAFMQSHYQDQCEGFLGAEWDHTGNQNICPETSNDKIACYNTVIQDDGFYETQCEAVEKP